MKTKHFHTLLAALLLCCTACYHTDGHDLLQAGLPNIADSIEAPFSSVNAANDIEDSLSLNVVTGLEIPSYSIDEDLYTYTGYVSSYNHKTLVPNWVAYCLTDEDVEGTFSQSCSFSRDPQVKGRQASREDYSNSGYDKGHMAPRADMKWSQEACYQSYFFTNICPQVHSMNAGCWSKLEQQARRVATHYGTEYIVCGPIFDSLPAKSIGDAHVCVPTRFFKALLVPDGDGYHAIAFIMSNSSKKQNPRTSAMTVDRLEKIIHRDLFPTLDDKWEKQVEAAYDWGRWDY